MQVLSRPMVDLFEEERPQKKRVQEVELAMQPRDGRAQRVQLESDGEHDPSDSPTHR